MNIPDKAVEAAAKADVNRDADEYGTARWATYDEHDRTETLRQVRHMLEAAAKIIAAQALRDAEDAAYNTDDGSFIDVYRAEISEWLTTRADELEAGK